MTDTTLAWLNVDYHLLLPALPDLLWGTVAFLIVAIPVYKFAWPSFKAVLDERAEKIDEGLRAAEVARAEIADQRVQLQEDRKSVV